MVNRKNENPEIGMTQIAYSSNPLSIQLFARKTEVIAFATIKKSNPATNVQIEIKKEPKINRNNEDW